MGKKKKKPAARKRVAAADDQGPLTLAEAKALAQAKSPKRANLSGRPVAVVTPETVGAARENLEQQNRDENARRIREYKATMMIMKKRGVKGLAEKAAALERGGKAAVSGAQPLQVFAEGDSWFHYPYPFFGGGIIPRLEDRLGVPILSLAKAGDEVRNMLGVEERELIATHLNDGCPAGGDWDVMLFSGGGNDIVGDPMAIWIKDFNPDVPPAKLIHQKRFDAALALVRAGYEDLIGLRNSLSPGTHLVFQAYDFAIPDGRGVCRMGPWLKPSFDLHKIRRRAVAFEVVKNMLQQFAKLLLSLEKNHPRVTFINGQGTLPPRTSSWHNELHPSKQGFEKFADLFHQELNALFPDRVL